MISGLDSASLKVVRATEHLDAIKNIIRSLASAADSYEIVRDANGKEKIHFLMQPPSQITLLVGEIVYQLRSALDHLAFDLVRHNASDITLPSNWFNRSDFPLWLKIPNDMIKSGHTRPPLPYNCFKGTLPGITKAAFAFIESVQPYRSGPGPHNAMRLIAQLSNIDRHRYLNVTLPKATQYHHLVMTEGRQYAYGRGGLGDGAEIESSPPKADDILDVRRTFSTYITFEEPAVGSGPDTLEVEHVLGLCLDQVERVVIPAFIQLLKNP